MVYCRRPLLFWDLLDIPCISEYVIAVYTEAESVWAIKFP